MTRPWWRNVATLGLVCLLGACAARESLPQFYLLTPGGGGAGVVGRSRGPSIYVRRVEVAPYLAKNSPVMLRAGNNVDYAVSARWAEPLDQGVARALADALNQTNRVRPAGFSLAGPPVAHDYDVNVRLLQFEGTDTGEAVLSARYEVVPSGGTEPVAARSFTTRRLGWQPGDYAGLARLLSEELAELGGEVARALQARGWRVRALHRDPERVRAGDASFDWVKGDALDAA